MHGNRHNMDIDFNVPVALEINPPIHDLRVFQCAARDGQWSVVGGQYEWSNQWPIVSGKRLVLNAETLTNLVVSDLKFGASNHTKMHLDASRCKQLKQYKNVRQMFTKTNRT